LADFSFCDFGAVIAFLRAHDFIPDLDVIVTFEIFAVLTPAADLGWLTTRGHITTNRLIRVYVADNLCPGPRSRPVREMAETAFWPSLGQIVPPTAGFAGANRHP
jgi:hypothetical protein